MTGIDCKKNISSWIIGVLLLLTGSIWSHGVTLTVSSCTAPAGAVAGLSLAISAESSAEKPTVLVFQGELDVMEGTFLTVAPDSRLADLGKVLQFQFIGNHMIIVIFGGQSVISDGILATLWVVLPAGQANGAITLSDAGSSASDEAAEPIAVTGGAGTITVAAGLSPHTADSDQNWRISLSELLRIVQFYNSNGYHCAEGTEDGYGAGAGEITCTAHDADYAPQDWSINLSELLRMIQMFNSFSGVYSRQSDSEDGYAPGPFTEASYR